MNLLERIRILNILLVGLTFTGIVLCLFVIVMVSGLKVLPSDKSEASFQKGQKNVREAKISFTNEESFIDYGHQIFDSRGCNTCHGEDGEGGVPNPNYINDKVPAINNLADKMYLYSKEDAETVIKLLKEDKNLEQIQDDPPFRRYSRFYAQYESVMNKILNGTMDLQKKDPSGPAPPLNMPAWENNLSKKEIHSILAYLVSEYDYEDD